MFTKVLIISFRALSVNSFFFRHCETSGRQISGMYSCGAELLSSRLLEHEVLPLINEDDASRVVSVGGMAELLAGVEVAGVNFCVNIIYTVY